MAPRTNGVATPETVYAGRLHELQRLQSKDRQWDRFFTSSKLFLLVLVAGIVVWSLKHPARLGFLSIPAALLVVLFVLHERTLRALQLRGRAVQYYERGLARLRDAWAGTGEGGERFLDPAHPYARDLDLFGTGSLFELLCTARTHSGEQTLANWLLTVPPLEEIRERQAAISELKEQLTLRESLWALGENVRVGVHPEALAAWAEGKSFAAPMSIRIVLLVLAALWLASLACWGLWGLRSVALLISVVNLGFTYRFHRSVEQSIDQVDSASKDLKLLAEVLEFFEQAAFQSPKLVHLQAALRRDGIPPSAAIRRLGRIVDYVESRHNWFVKVFDQFVFWSAQLAFSIENWRRDFGPAIRSWLEAVGELEALAALSRYAYEHADDVLPDFVPEPVDAESSGTAPLFDAVGFAHPLLPETTAVRNDLRLGREVRLIIISGPNMAGKSTFMRAVGVNVVLAQCGAPVRARSLRLSRLAVAASICILDSLQGGISRFYAEIRRLKLISDLTSEPLPVLFLLDELLSGTNSHDRFAGTKFIVRSLVDAGAIGLVSTHDLALTEIPAAIGPSAINCHFEDEFDDGQLKFDYRLHPGIVQTSNALELMRSIGLKVRD